MSVCVFVKMESNSEEMLVSLEEDFCVSMCTTGTNKGQLSVHIHSTQEQGAFGRGV